MTQTPHLYPCCSIFTETQHSLDYHLAVRRVLLPDNISDALCSAVVLPGLQKEWALFIHPGRLDIEVRVLDYQIHGALTHGKDLPSFTAYNRPIDREFAEDVWAAFFRILRTTAYPDPYNDGVGLDGDCYYFYSNGLIVGEGELSGCIWSPDVSTNAGKLVSLLGSLREFAESPPGKSSKSEDEIRKAATEIATL